MRFTRFVVVGNSPVSKQSGGPVSVVVCSSVAGRPIYTVIAVREGLKLTLIPPFG